jgi:hypothetical protein
MPGWQSLSRRGTKLSAADETLFEDVPAHLVQPLLYWFGRLFEEMHPRGDAERRAHRIAARLQLDLRRVPMERLNIRPVPADRRALTAHAYSAAQTLLACAGWGLIRTSGERPIETAIQLRRRGLLPKGRGVLLLDMIDAALADGVEEKDANELERLLTDGGSAWRVADDSNSLQRRVNPSAIEAFRTLAEGVAATHLSVAWAAAYGRNPIPSRAYSEAIKAVEAATIPVVLPRDRMATLGKVIGELRHHPERWRLAVRTPEGGTDISTLLAMLRLLWEGQTDRHGTSTAPVPVTAEAAESAVHLAVTLVQWFHSGAVRHVNMS